MARVDTHRPVTLHGLKLSYFTGKLEAYLRAKGIGYGFVEMDTADFRRCARITGVAQMPQLELEDGTWLTDTSHIIRRFEANRDGPRLSPIDAATGWISQLLEDFGDEWLWRPALYYRWHFAEDRRLMSAQIARSLTRDVRLPFWLRRQFILRRQRRVFLTQDGVTRTTARQVEQLYCDTLDAMQAILTSRPFLMGARPVEADFGFFGSMFRHFASDPTPAAIMRERAPAVFAWVARLWNLTPGAIAGQPVPAGLADDLAPLLRAAADHYLPYLRANEAAWGRRARYAEYCLRGIEWRVPVNPYRVRCFDELKRAYAGLDADAQSTIARHMGADATSLLAGAPATVPIDVPTAGHRPLDRQWRVA